jgi:hypothetical protein
MKPAVSMILKNGLEGWSLAIATERFLWVGLQCDQPVPGEEKARLSDLAVSAGEIWGFNSPIGFFSVVRVALFGSLGVSPTQSKILGTAYEAFDDTVDSPVWQDGAGNGGERCSLLGLSGENDGAQIYPDAYSSFAQAAAR